MEAPDAVIKAYKAKRAEDIRLSNVIRRIMIRMKEDPGALPDVQRLILKQAWQICTIFTVLPPSISY